MKKKSIFLLYLLAPVTVLFSVSCTKHHETNGSTADCISRIVASQTSTVDPADLDTIRTLFRINRLPTASLQFFSVMIDSVSYPGFTGIQEQVQANLFINGLPVYINTEVYNFGDGQFQPGNTFVYQGVLPSTDTTTHQTLEALRNAYLDNYQRISVVSPVANPGPPTHPGAAYRDSCLVAQLGYIDPFWFTNIQPVGKSLIKVWKVSPLSGGYPTVYVEDGTGAIYPENPSFF